MRSRYLLLCLVVIAVIGSAFTNCSGGVKGTTSDQSSLGPDGSGSPCAGVNASPQSISDTVALINTLPRPLTVDCFLNALAKPMQVYAVNNSFSAQPAMGVNSPRIFILYPTFVLSVVPAGSGSTVIEMSEVKSSGSVKGEIAFPVNGVLSADNPFTHIVSTTNTSQSKCTLCHSGEAPVSGYPGPAFISSFVRPDSAKRVTAQYLKNQAKICDPLNDAYRCAILNAIYVSGKAVDGNFP